MILAHVIGQEEWCCGSKIPHLKGVRAEAKQIKQETEEGAGFRFEPIHPMAFHIPAEAEKNAEQDNEALYDLRRTVAFVMKI